ncbi:uncharacterized protein LOC126778808 isoform X2 [Nymphalis io]|uniref:uncharacterized protein LOC126778808 isoform X2 n=1 Tax=Inachis io TaxID=171585 RepID=UPI002166D364|nr:uncharacterized protein LOC126778808 isoform X2 [Nymphalis io]
MFKSIIISIFLNLSNFILTPCLVESDSVKPMMERNNIVNKGLWVRNKPEIKNPGDFIFRANSLDADSILQNNFEAFGDNNMQNSPFLTSYFERNKRSPLIETKQPSKENLNKCKNKSQCLNKDQQMESIVKSKFISTLKPGSVFNDYPHAVAALINDNEKYYIDNSKQNHIEHNKDIRNSNRDTKTKLNNVIKSNNENIKLRTDFTEANELNTTSFIRRNNNGSSIITNRYKHSNEAEFTEVHFKPANDTVIDKKNTVRDTFDGDEVVWQNSAPIPDTNTYKTLPKFTANNKNKPITERGLVKVLTMLTKTFKKIMKEHNDIKKIHNRLYNLNDDFVKNVEALKKKLGDFNSKYFEILKANQELKQVETKLNDKVRYFLSKEKEISKNLIEFENQQKKFLAQQRQFYDAQKLMLSQNEKINLKQDVIAKTQSEIAHRQNNFARILKKAKEIYVKNKNVKEKLNSNILRPKANHLKEKTKTINQEYSTRSTTTERVKINLFSIPTRPLSIPLTQNSDIENQNKLLLDEKDNHAIDDLIYKYYFNNTFIDEIYKNKILSTFLAAPENTDYVTKSKRNESKPNTTQLLPVNKTTKIIKFNRERRWIKHSNKNIHIKDKPSVTRVVNIKGNVIDIGHTVPTFSKVNLKKITTLSDPYMTITLNFCKEIGQDQTLEALNWCVEKTLRRLQVIDFKPASIMPPLKQSKESEKKNILQGSTSQKPTTLKTSTTEDPHPSSTPTTEPSWTMFFPDNEELEDKLRDYELKPDTEGTVYYDGSLHSSDIGRIDVMPGLESDSRVQVDPLALDLQAQRRAEVRKINERIMKMRFG